MKPRLHHKKELRDLTTKEAVIKELRKQVQAFPTYQKFKQQYQQ